MHLYRFCTRMTRLWPVAALVLAGLTAGCILLPGCAMWFACALALAMGVWGAFLLHRPKGDPTLAEASAIAVDQHLLAPDPPVCTVFAPFDEGDAQPMKPLFLLTACAITLPLLPGEVQPVYQQKLKDLRLRGAVQTHFPILEEVSLPGAQGYIVKDGHGRRAYLTGSPAVLGAMCPQLMDRQPRPMEAADLLRLEQHGGWAFAMAAVTAQGMEDLIYLGSMDVTAPAEHPALRSARALQAAGWHVTPWAEGTPLPPGTLLVTMQEAHTGGLTAARQDDFAAPIRAARLHAQQTGRKLYAAIAHICCVILLGLLLGAPWWTLPAAAALLALGTARAAPAESALPWRMAGPPVIFLAAGLMLHWFFQAIGMTAESVAVWAVASAAWVLGQCPPGLKPAPLRDPLRLAALVTGALLCAAAWLIPGTGLISKLFTLAGVLLTSLLARLCAGP